LLLSGNSVFTSDAYRATAPNAAFPERKAAPRGTVLFKVEVKMLECCG
jgi:hypothetical protein